MTVHVCKFNSVSFAGGNGAGPIVGGVLGVFVALIILIPILVVVVVLIMRARKRQGKDIQGRYTCPVIPCVCVCVCVCSLVPRPLPAFQCCMQKSGRAWYSKSHAPRIA